MPIVITCNYAIIKDTRAEAEDWIKQHRCKYPAVYNVARLTETPLPEQPNRETREESADIVGQMSFERISLGDADNASVRENAANAGETGEAVTETLSICDDTNNNLLDRDNAADPLATVNTVDIEEALEIFLISSDDEDGETACGGAVATTQFRDEMKIAKIKCEDGPDASDEDARESIRSLLTETSTQAKSSNAVPSRATVPLPVSCKMEYDSMSGFIPFVVDVSVFNGVKHVVQSTQRFVIIFSFNYFSSKGTWPSQILLPPESIQSEVLCAAANRFVGRKPERRRNIHQFFVDCFHRNFENQIRIRRPGCNKVD